jgi:pimeloyl-[acyl-carrier protein] methyl ester esterase
MNGLALHIERSGQGAPLVFWHGWGLNLRVFDALRGALGSAGVPWRTEAVDLPGHGLSPWREEGRDAVLARLVESLPAGSTLLGWSLGGQFAMRAALAAPERVARLVLVGATPRFTAAPGWPQGLPPESLTLMQSRLAEDYRRTVGEFLELQVRGSRDATQSASALRAALLRHGEAEPEALAAGLDWLAQHDLRDSLAQVRQPALVIAGQHDRVTPPAASAALAATLPRARYLQIPRAAHAPFLSHPVEFLAALLGFLQEAQAA